MDQGGVVPNQIFGASLIVFVRTLFVGQVRAISAIYLSVEIELRIIRVLELGIGLNSRLALVGCGEGGRPLHDWVARPWAEIALAD